MAVVVLPTPPFWLVTAMIFVNLDHGSTLFHVKVFHVKRSPKNALGGKKGLSSSRLSKTFHVKHLLPSHKYLALPQGSWIVFHVKHFPGGGCAPANKPSWSAIKLADSSMSEYFTARDTAQSKRASMDSARLEITLTLGKSREASRKNTLFR